MPPLAGVALVSLGTAAALLLVVRHTTDQRRMAAVKRQIRAGLFEVRLFNDDPRAIFRAQGEMVRHTVTYMRLSAAPLLWMLVPLIVIVGQVQAYYGYDGVRAGQAVVVTASLAGTAVDTPDVRLEAPEGLRVEAGVWIPSRREAAWRVVAERDGEYDLAVRVGEQRVAKRLVVSDAPARRSPVRAGWLAWVLDPGEAPLPRESAVRAVAVPYAGRVIAVAGIGLHWLVIYFLLTLIFAFSLRRPFGVIF